MKNPNGGRRGWLVAAFLALGAAMSGVAQERPASIEGRIVFEDDGKPLAGATVTAIHYNDRFKNLGPYVAGVATADAKGAYKLTGLPAGQYVLCAEASSAAVDLVKPCEWGLAGEALRLLSGVTPTGIDRAIPRGRLVEVDVDDAGGHLDREEKTGTGVHLLVGIWGPNRMFHTARVSKTDKKSRTYAVVMPFGTPVSMDVRGRKLDLEDDKGRAKKEDDALEVLTETRSASRSARKVVVTVKGVKP